MKEAVAGLRRGSGGRESHKVVPVPQTHIEKITPFFSRQIWAMIRLQLLTGMRPGEVVRIRRRDLDMTGRMWEYRPAQHKREYLYIYHLMQIAVDGKCHRQNMTHCQRRDLREGHCVLRRGFV